jgi:hypothetical protein
VGSEKAYAYEKDANNGCSFDILQRCHKAGGEFLNNIVRVTGDETWLLFLNVETEEQ